MLEKLLNKSDILLIKRSINYIKPYRLKFFLAFLCVIFGVILGIIQPLIWSTLLTNLFNKNYNFFIHAVAYTALLFIIQAILTLIQSYTFSYLSNSIIYDLKRDMYKNMLDLPVKAFDDMRTGEFISRLQNDTSIVADILTNKFLGSIVDILKVIFIGIAVFIISVPLALLILVCFPISYIILNIFGKILRNKNKEIMKINDNYISNIQQSISGIREVKSLGIKSNRFVSFLTIASSLKNKSINFTKISSIAQILADSTLFISQIASMSIGGYFIFTNMLSIGSFIAFSSYSNQFSNSLMNITNLNCNIQQSLASLERIFNLMDNLSYSKQIYGNVTMKNVKGMITFEDISFKYTDDKVALNNINFEIQPNKKIALIGPSGGGKTTIFNLLLRFYEPTSGNIKIDGIKITDLDEQILRNNISIVRQDLYLFNMSIKDNLLLVNPCATIDEIQEACKLAYIHDFIMTLPQKYDSIIGENGESMSSGQKQRLAIARALLKKSKILLLDEITSSLDSQSQVYIRDSINTISKNHTVIMIAHRLSTIAIADEIFIVDKGKICEKGTHSFLLKESKLYKNLLKSESYDLKAI